MFGSGCIGFGSVWFGFVKCRKWQVGSRKSEVGLANKRQGLEGRTGAQKRDENLTLTATDEGGLAAVLLANYGMQVWTTLLDSLAKRDARLDTLAVHVVRQVCGTQPILVGALSGSDGAATLGGAGQGTNLG